MKKQLRYYQVDAVKAIIASLGKGEAPYCNLVTGSGKSLILADLSKRALRQCRRVMQVVPNGQLLRQNFDETQEYMGADIEIGICSAKLNRFELKNRCIIATQTSLLRRVHQAGKIDLLLIDEADLCSPNTDSTYQKIIASLFCANPRIKIVGVTGSPYRQDQGLLHNEPRNGVRIFTDLCYESDITKLIKEGYISNVKILNTDTKVDLKDVHKVAGDYNLNECGIKFDKILRDAVRDFKVLADKNNIKTALIFASTIANAERIMGEYGNHNDCRMAHGGTTEQERKELIDWLINGTGRRFLVNVGLYTRGFDYPGLEAIILLRATTSVRLYVQMVGRLLRTHGEKPFGWLIDYGTNVDRLGPIDNLKPPNLPGEGDAPQKLCLECWSVNFLTAKKCKDCGAEFVPSEDGNYTMRTKAKIMGSEHTSVIWNSRITYSKKDSTPMIRVDFFDAYGFITTHYLCLDHKNFAREKALEFIKNWFINDDIYDEIMKLEGGANVENIDYLMNNRNNLFKTVSKIVVKKQKDSKFSEITEITFI